MKKKLFYVLASVCMLGLLKPVAGQDIAEEEALLQEVSASEAGGTLSSRVNVQQAGDANQAYIQQINLSNSNVAEIAQTGYGNVVNLNYQGDAFSVYLSQDGDQNEYHGEVEGQEATMQIHQQGNFNSINQDFRITDANLTIIQEGEGHRLIQTTDVRNALGMRIIQKGNAATVIIR